MLVLAFDTALDACSAALVRDDDTLANVSEPLSRGHAERLAPMLREIMSSAGSTFRDLDAIAVTTGPGTFTGVRIGLAMARSLSIALNRPAIGISTLEALAHTAAGGRSGSVAGIIDARRGQVYVQVFDRDMREIASPQALPPEDAARLLPDSAWLVGSGARLVKPFLPDAEVIEGGSVPDAATIARLAQQREPDRHPAIPLYLRAPDAKPQARQAGLTPLKVNIQSTGPEASDMLSSLHGAGFEKGWEADEFRTMLNAPGMLTLVAKLDTDDTPAGFIVCRAAAGEAEIITLAVRTECRRRNVANRLVEQAVKQLKEVQAGDLHLEVDSENIAARSLYLKAGFAVTGKRPGYYRKADGTRSDAVIMSRKL